MLTPSSIYEYLPTIYVISGFFTSRVIDNTLAIGSSLLLIAAGILVYHMRLEYRSKRAVRNIGGKN